MLVWDLAGRPDCGKPTVGHDGPCYVCGNSCGGIAVRSKDAIGVNFDHTRAGNRLSTHVCAPCAWAMGGKPPLSLRMWSGLAVPGRDMPPNHPKCAFGTPPAVHLTNRADMRAVADVLCDPPDGPWVAWIAVSGQKHVLPYTAVNHGSGRWAVQIEDVKAVSTPGEFALLLAHVIRLRQAGFPEAAIFTGNPGTWMDRPERLAAWRTHGEAVKPYADSPVLQLACMIPTKGTIDDLAARYGHLAPAAAPERSPEPAAVRPGLDQDRGDVPGHDDELRLF